MARPSSTLCPSCGQLVGIRDAECLNCGRRNPGMWGLTPLLRGFQDESAFAQFVMWACGALYLASLVADLGGVSTAGLSFLSPSIRSLFRFGASGAVPVFVFHHWWSVLSAGWLHGGVLHIVFNMYWVRSLAPPTAHYYGPGRTVIIYTVSGVVGFLASSVAGAAFPFLPGFLRGAGFTLGASASILGLLGALLYYGRRGSGHVGRQAKSLVLLLLVFGFVIPGVDNWAHLGGLGGGYLVAKWLDPLKPERGDHVLIAVICLAASLLAILVSLVTGPTIPR